MFGTSVFGWGLSVTLFVCFERDFDAGFNASVTNEAGSEDSPTPFPEAGFSALANLLDRDRVRLDFVDFASVALFGTSEADSVPLFSEEITVGGALPDISPLDFFLIVRLGLLRLRGDFARGSPSLLLTILPLGVILRSWVLLGLRSLKNRTAEEAAMFVKLLRACPYAFTYEILAVLVNQVSLD